MDSTAHVITVSVTKVNYLLGLVFTLKILSTSNTLYANLEVFLIPGLLKNQSLFCSKVSKWHGVEGLCMRAVSWVPSLWHVKTATFFLHLCFMFFHFSTQYLECPGICIMYVHVLHFRLCICLNPFNTSACMWLN